MRGGRRRGRAGERGDNEEVSRGEERRGEMDERRTRRESRNRGSEGRKRTGSLISGVFSNNFKINFKKHLQHKCKKITLVGRGAAGGDHSRAATNDYFHSQFI